MGRRVVKSPPELVVEYVPIGSLKPHPRNYRSHPPDQIAHIAQSLTEQGFYRNIVVARDDTILAGHGVHKAAGSLGFGEVPIVRLPLDPNDPRALKVLTGDNEMEHLAEQDDRLLSEILREIRDFDPSGLVGTGFDEMMLANLVFVSRPASEIGSFDAALEWAGMPAHNPEPPPLKVVLNFRSVEDKMRCGELLGLKLTEKSDTTWWPEREKLDAASAKFE